jgi:hypothetical protein
MFDELVSRNISYTFFELSQATTSMVRVFKKAHDEAIEKERVRLQNAQAVLQSSFYNFELNAGDRAFERVLDSVLRLAMLEEQREATTHNVKQ